MPGSKRGGRITLKERRVGEGKKTKRTEERKGSHEIGGLKYNPKGGGKFMETHGDPELVHDQTTMRKKGRFQEGGT